MQQPGRKAVGIGERDRSFCIEEDAVQKEYYAVRAKVLFASVVHYEEAQKDLKIRSKVV